MRKSIIGIAAVAIMLTLILGTPQQSTYAGGYYKQHNCWFSPYIWCSGNGNECGLAYVCKQKKPKPKN